MSHPFNAPAASTGIEWAALKGSLLLITVHEVRKEIATSFGVTDAIAADVEVLDGPEAGNTYNDTLIFPRVLQSQLAKSVGGQMVLGRLGQGQAKPGQTAPWTLVAATDADNQLGVRHLAAKRQTIPTVEAPF
jgi:hypothetical protein